MSVSALTTLVDLSSTSPASASATVLGTSSPGIAIYGKAVVHAILQGGTGGTTDIYLQSTIDGTHWYDLCHFAQLADGASVISYVASFSRGGTATAPTLVNAASGTPSIAANTIITGVLGNALRTAMVTGGGVSAGATQVISVLCSTI